MIEVWADHATVDVMGGDQLDLPLRISKDSCRYIRDVLGFTGILTPVKNNFFRAYDFGIYRIVIYYVRFGILLSRDDNKHR